MQRSILRAVSYTHLPAVMVIAGVMPIDLMAGERKRVYKAKEDLRVIEPRRMARKHSMWCCQLRWDQEIGKGW